jgi:selenocysteine-specific elongation factor
MADVKFLYLSSEKGKLENRTRIRFHVGTTEVVGRVIILDSESVQPGSEAFIQIHFERPIVADVGDRFVIRSYSPVRTIGGGSILDVHPEKHKRFQQAVGERLSQLSRGDPEQLLLEQLERVTQSFVSTANLAKLASLPPEECSRQLQELLKKEMVVGIEKEMWFASSNLLTLKQKVGEMIGKLHSENPLKLAVSASEVHSRLKPAVERPLFDYCCKLLQKEESVTGHGDRIALRSHVVQLSPEHKAIKEKILAALTKAPLMPPGQREIVAAIGKEAEKIFSLMIEGGEVIRLEQDIVMHQSAIEKAKLEIKSYLSRKHRAGLGEIREHLGITRKYALPLLLYLDSIGFTERDGDVRTLHGV